jgi:hypothetical protein
VHPWIFVGLLLASPHGETSAQVVPDSVPVAETTPPATGGWSAFGVLSHPWSTVVAVTAILPVGGAQDPDGSSGTAWLLGNTVRDMVSESLEGSAAEVTVQVDRGRTIFQVLTPPDEWEPAYDALQKALFEETLAVQELDLARASLQAVMAFEAGAPVREFELETHRLIGGAEAGWSRDPRGTSASLSEVRTADLATYRNSHYARDRGVLTIAGAADPAWAARVVTGRSSEPAAGGAVIGVAQSSATPSGPAWTDGDRVRLVRDVTSGWIAAAYPVDPTTPRTSVEFIMHRARSELMTDPPPPGLFAMEIELQPLPAGLDAVLVRAAVLPDALESWERRILETMAQSEEELLDPGLLRFHRRRFQNGRLVEDATPEAEGLRAALDLLNDGRIRDLPTEIRALDAESVQRAGASLGLPRVLILGPDLGDGAGSPPP